MTRTASYRPAVHWLVDNFRANATRLLHFLKQNAATTSPLGTWATAWTAAATSHFIVHPRGLTRRRQRLVSARSQAAGRSRMAPIPVAMNGRSSHTMPSPSLSSG